MDNQAEPPATLRLKRQAIALQGELDVESIQYRALERATQLAKVCGGIDKRSLTRHQQRAVNVGVPVQKLDRAAQHGLRFRAFRTYSLDRDQIDRRGELVRNSVIQLAQQSSHLGSRRVGVNSRHYDLLSLAPKRMSGPPMDHLEGHPSQAAT
jgi:hypothetical protein